MVIKENPHSPMFQYSWIFWLFSAISWTLVGRVLSLCRDAVGAFCSPRRLGQFWFDDRVLRFFQCLLSLRVGPVGDFKEGKKHQASLFTARVDHRWCLLWQTSRVFLFNQSLYCLFGASLTQRPIESSPYNVISSRRWPPPPGTVQGLQHWWRNQSNGCWVAEAMLVESLEESSVETNYNLYLLLYIHIIQMHAETYSTQ